MIGDELIKAYGSITKEEDLINIELFTMPNTLVLESLHPFPGYHGNSLPEGPDPNLIYLVTDIRYEGEDILRAAKKVRAKLPCKFNASFGRAEISQNTYQLIRLADLERMDCIRSIQEAFMSEGITFAKKKSVSGDALIYLQKFFSFEKMDGNIYRDTDNPLMHYFEIPDRPPWPFFRKITFYIRGNVDYYSYDAALGTVYMEELHDMVRIFSRDLTLEQLNFIRLKYLYEIAHPDHLG